MSLLHSRFEGRQSLMDDSGGWQRYVDKTRENKEAFLLNKCKVELVQLGAYVLMRQGLSFLLLYYFLVLLKCRYNPRMVLIFQAVYTHFDRFFLVRLFIRLVFGVKLQP